MGKVDTLIEYNTFVSLKGIEDVIMGDGGIEEAALPNKDETRKVTFVLINMDQPKMWDVLSQCNRGWIATNTWDPCDCYSPHADFGGKCICEPEKGDWRCGSGAALYISPTPLILLCIFITVTLLL